MLPALNAVMLTASEQGPVEISTTAQGEDGANLTEYTFAGLSLGATDSRRHIFVVVAIANIASTSVTVTVGGVACTAVLQVRDTGTSDYVGIFKADSDPAGTTGDVVVTPPDAGGHCGVGVIRVVNWTAKAVSDTDSFTGSTGSLTVTVPSNGFAIAYFYDDAGGSFSISGDLTSRFVRDVEGGSAFHGCAFDAEITGSKTSTASHAQAGVAVAYAK